MDLLYGIRIMGKCMRVCSIMGRLKGGLEGEEGREKRNRLQLGTVFL